MSPVDESEFDWCATGPRTRPVAVGSSRSRPRSIDHSKT